MLLSIDKTTHNIFSVLKLSHKYVINLKLHMTTGIMVINVVSLTFKHYSY